jgi:nitric oxide dioxygenase
MKNIKEMIEYPNEGILSKEIVKNSELDATLFCMAAGKEISGHTSVKPGYVHVLEGKGIFNLEGEDIEMKEGVFIYMDKNAVHALKAEENTAFVLVLIHQKEN